MYTKSNRESQKLSIGRSGGNYHLKDWQVRLITNTDLPRSIYSAFPQLDSVLIHSSAAAQVTNVWSEKSLLQTLTVSIIDARKHSI